MFTLCAILTHYESERECFEKWTFRLCFSVAVLLLIQCLRLTKMHDTRYSVILYTHVIIDTANSVTYPPYTLAHSHIHSSDQQNQVARTHTWIERQTNSSFDVHGLNNLKKCQTRIMTHSTRILRYTITILCVLKVDIQTVPINRNKLMNIKLWCIMHCDMYL